MHKEKYRSEKMENNVLLKIVSKEEQINALLVAGLQNAFFHLENRIYTQQTSLLCYKKDQYTKINGINFSIRKMEEKYFCLDIYKKKYYQN